MTEQQHPVERIESVPEQMGFRIEKLRVLKENGQDPYQITTARQTHHATDIVADFERLENETVSVAGRLLARRGMGKVSFADLLDRSGTIQIFSRLNNLGDESYAAWQNLDIGDLVEVTGEVFRTKMGEVSIRNVEWKLLAKSLRPLPEKFHGLRDTDTRYRKRYLDLIVNPEVRETFIKRSRIISFMREELERRQYLEVETPLLNTIPGGATARPFVTHHNALDLDLYLRIAPELFLKRLIVGGLERVYEIGRNFRNEGMSNRHNPEFTMLELYEAYGDYHSMMELSEALVSGACMDINGTYEIEYQGTPISLAPPWRRMTMVEAVREFAGIDFDLIATDEEARAAARERGLNDVPATMTWGEALSECFEEFAEEHLIQPTFIIDYPIEVSPLAKIKQGTQGRLTERFEIFIYGREHGNAYSELNDPFDQARRFEDQMRRREAGDEEANLPDYDFVEALEIGMPPTGGLGIGIDRVVMLLTDQPSIRDVLLFPTMKPLGSQIVEEQASGEQSAEAYDQITTDFEELDFSKVKVEPLFEDMVDFETFSKSDFRVVKVLNCEEVPKSKKLLKFTLDDGSGQDRIILSGIKEYYDAADLIGKTLVAITNLPERKMMGIPSQGMVISAVYEYDGEEGLNLLILDDNIPAGAKLY